MKLFNKIFKVKVKKAIMGWRFIKYTDGDKAIMFVIEPMVGVSDLVYLHDEESWKSYAPDWAKNRYSEISVPTLKANPNIQLKFIVIANKKGNVVRPHRRNWKQFLLINFFGIPINNS